MVDRGDPVTPVPTGNKELSSRGPIQVGSNEGQPNFGPGPTPPAAPGIRTNCPHCAADLVLLRVISGRAGNDYWVQLCEQCSSIHLDIVKGYR